MQYLNYVSLHGMLNFYLKNLCVHYLYLTSLKNEVGDK